MWCVSDLCLIGLVLGNWYPLLRWPDEGKCLCLVMGTSWSRDLLGFQQPTVSHYAFALIAFEPVTSTKQIISPNTALNATAEMQPSADISENLGTQLIFQLIDACISNKDEMRSASQLVAKLLHHESNCASQLATKLLHHESSCASRLAAHASCLKSYETSYVFQLVVAHAKCHNKSNEFAFRLIIGFIQKFQSQLQQDLVDLSLSNAFSIAKLTSTSIKAKSNSAMLIDLTTSQQSTMINCNNGSSKFIVLSKLRAPSTTLELTQLS